MVLLPCEGCEDGYPDDWTDKEDDTDPQEMLDYYADRLHDELKCGDITEGQAKSRFSRAKKKIFNRRF